ncbi:hypothetical protein [Micromonospora deserti]|nr:hypothetical protein [Micromonospora deserti]
MSYVRAAAEVARQEAELVVQDYRAAAGSNFDDGWPAGRRCGSTAR